MVEALSTDPSRDFWLEVKKFKGTNKGMPSVIDGVSESKNIANLFAEKFSGIYNSVSFNHRDMDKLEKEIDQAILDTCCNGVECSNSQIKHLHDVTNQVLKNV